VVLKALLVMSKIGKNINFYIICWFFFSWLLEIGGSPMQLVKKCLREEVSIPFLD